MERAGTFPCRGWWRPISALPAVSKDCSFDVKRGEAGYEWKFEHVRPRTSKWLSRINGRGAPGIDMPLTCAHASHMSRMVQIRNVPDTLHRKLKARAADSGQTLSDYLLAELERLAARPTRDEMLARLHSRKRVTLKTPAAVVIREERDSA
jgi:antitoxin FitA